MITKREAERLVKSFLEDHAPPQLPENFAFNVAHTCGWGCKGQFIPSRYNSSRAKCIKCCYCAMFFSPNKFIFHFHRAPDAKYRHPDAANFNSWRRHLELDYANVSDDLVHAWEDVKAMFNGGSRKRVLSSDQQSPKHDDMSEISREAPSIMSPKRQRATDDLTTSTPNSQNQLQTPFGFPPGPFINNPSSSAPFLPPAPHPHPAAFPFFGQGHGNINSNNRAGHVTGQELVPAGAVDKMNFADMWKAKPPAAAAAYYHPLNLLWAKNLANMDPGMNPFRGVFDPEMLGVGRSRDHSDVIKGTQSSVSDKSNRFSAFKPVGMFGNGPYDARIEEVVNNVVNSASPALSMTPSPPLSDEVEPDIDVTDGEEMISSLNKQTEQPATIAISQPHEHHQQQRNSPHATNKTLNNNDVKAEEKSNAAVTSCPGHVTKSGNAKNYSVEFLACTENSKVSIVFSLTFNNIISSFMPSDLIYQ